MEHWIEIAKACGFTDAAPLNMASLKPMASIREACTENRCRAYGKNWTCPPHCGSLESCEERLRGYHRGILLQTVGTTEKLVDTRAYTRIEQEHLNAFYRFADALREAYPNALCLGAGGCRVCTACAWPEPCRFPEKACASMEAYGLFVTQICRESGMLYYHGEKTVTYCACILF